MKRIHTIEPTLHDETGHCCSYLDSLLSANTDRPIELVLWIGKGGTDLFKDRTTTHGHFSRRWRKIQLWQLTKRLLRQGETIFLPTAGRTDLLLIDQFDKYGRFDAQIFLHFHQLNRTEKKLKSLQALATRHRNIHILTPTTSLKTCFEDCGFKNVRVVPCPTYPPTFADATPSKATSKIIYAGAARADKGIAACASLVEYLENKNSTLPIHIQVSPPHSGRFDATTQQAVNTLTTINYSHLTTYKDTLDKHAYQDFFQNSICLQLYDSAFYADKFSGITLDTLYAGSPIITTPGTWIAETVQRFDAGVVLNDTSSKSVDEAIQLILKDINHYKKNATQAGKTLATEHDPKQTLHALLEK